MSSNSASVDSKSTNGSRRHENNQEMVFRYGWRTIAANLGGLLVLALLAIVYGVDRLNQITVASVLLFFWTSLLVTRFVLENLSPRELMISDDKMIIRWHRKETTVPLADLKLIDSGVFSTFLDYVKLVWDQESILVFSHISEFKTLRKIISES